MSSTVTLRILATLLACFAPVSLAQKASTIVVTINVDAARSTLLAMQNPALSHEQALDIAGMRGNQGMLRKLHEFGLSSTTEDFANALYAIAHQQAVTKPAEKSVLLELVQPKTKQLLQLLDEMQENPSKFQDAIEQRIAMFTVPEANLHLDGYVVAGGDGGGYAFGDTDFFLNVGFADDLALAQSVTTHEMYHAVQGAFASSRELKLKGEDSAEHQVCSQIERLFANLYEEGSAVQVADPSVLLLSHSPNAKRVLTDMDDGMRHLDSSATLLEMSVLSLEATDPAPYDKVYAVGFFGHGVLYDIAHAMAKSIVETDGDAGFAKFLQEPSFRFVLRYTELSTYGKDKGHPRLGANTVAAANKLAHGCS